MKTIDISSLEGRFRPIAVVEQVLRVWNSGIWLMYWILMPLLAIGAVMGLLVFAEKIYSLLNPASPLISPEIRKLLSQTPYVVLSALFYYAINKAVFGYQRRWVIAAIVLAGAIVVTIAADWAAHGIAIYHLDREIFWYGFGCSLLSVSCYLFLLSALASILRLSRDQRELFRPIESPRVFPRKFMRAMTVLPDTIDLVRRRRTRSWVSILYIHGAIYYAIVPVTLIQSSYRFAHDVRIARNSCMSNIRKPECFIHEMHTAIAVEVPLAPIAILVCLALSRRILRGARRRLTLSLEEVTRIDQRRPIVFLRSFADDQIALKPPNASAFHRIFQGRIPDVPLEHIVLEHLTEIGPVIALGNPSETARPFGAARAYLPPDSWRVDLLEYLHKAAHIVVCLDLSEGLLWELEQIALNSLGAKCIFVVHPRFTAALGELSLTHRLEKAAGVLAPLLTAAQSDVSAPLLGWFQTEGQDLRLCRASTFSTSSVELFLRLFANSRKAVAARQAGRR